MREHKNTPTYYNSGDTKKYKVFTRHEYPPIYAADTSIASDSIPHTSDNCDS